MLAYYQNGTKERRLTDSNPVRVAISIKRGRPMFAIAWMIGDRRIRRNFACEKRAVRFDITQAKEL